MGCGGNKSTEIKINDINWNSLHDLGINLKESLVLFLSKKNITNINIGIYLDIIYSKKKGNEKIIKCKNEKFFLKNDKKKVVNNTLIKKYYEIYPHYINYSSVGTDEKFSPNFLLNNNFEKVFESLKIKVGKKNENKFAICFIDTKSDKNKNMDNFNEIKRNHEQNFFIYEIKNVNDDVYIPYENFIIFFKGCDVNFWVESNYVKNDNFDLFLSYKEDSINTNLETIENYIKENKEKEKEYNINYKYYEIFDKNGTQKSFKTFPIILISPSQENQNEKLIHVYQEKKPNFLEYIQTQINSNFIKDNLNITKIEIFKERITSLLLKTYFVSRKKYSLYFPPIKASVLFPLMELIDKINKNNENAYHNNTIENIIIMPEINTKFNFYKKDKFIYIIMNDSSCFNFAKTLLKKKYKDIYGNNVVKFICIYKNIDSEDGTNNIKMQLLKHNDETLFLSEDELINNEDNKNIFEFYFHTFNDINYFSHILLITNSEGIITYVNYFNNRAQIFQNLLKENGTNIKQGLELINAEKFKEVKKFYSETGKLLLNNIAIKTDEHIIQFNDKSTYEEFYKNNIFHQPYLSLKYNKVITFNHNSNQKFYKNYTLNYMNIENNMELNFDNYEHECLNEISYIYHEKDTYIEFKKDLRCKSCYNLLSKDEGLTKDKFIFYICPISKDIICRKCYSKNNKYEGTYPYNLLYIKCKEKFTFNYLPKDNALLFKERINYANHLELIDEKCDICNNQLCLGQNIKDTFYILVRIIKKNYFLVCKNCFELLINDDRDWIFEEKYDYVKDFIINYFIDLDNLIFKVVKFK